MAVYEGNPDTTIPYYCHNLKNLLDLKLGKIYFKFGDPKNKLNIEDDCKSISVKERKKINLDGLVSKYENVKGAIDLYNYMKNRNAGDPNFLSPVGSRCDHLFNDIPTFLKEIAGTIKGKDPEVFASQVEDLEKTRGECANLQVHGGVDKNEFSFTKKMEDIRAYLSNNSGKIDVDVLRRKFIKLVDESVDPDCVESYKDREEANIANWKRDCMKCFDEIMNFEKWRYFITPSPSQSQPPQPQQGQPPISKA
jgi:hypothetical protein